MLRACHRVLKPGGRMAFYVVRVQPGRSQEAAARMAGPDFVDAPEPYDLLLAQAEFVEIDEQDVTSDYEVTARRWLEVARELDAPLRAALGEDVMAQKHADRARALEAIQAGILGRALLTARHPG